MLTLNLTPGGSERSRRDSHGIALREAFAGTTGGLYQKQIRFARASGLSLRSNFGWTLAGNVIYAGCQWGVLIVIAKMGTPAIVGEFALALAVTAPIILLANQGLRALQATDAARQFEFGDYLGYRLLTTALALLVTYLLTGALAYPAVVWVVGVAKALESISDLLYGHYQSLDRMDRIATSMILRGILSVIAVGLLIRATHSIAWGAAGLALSTLLVLAVYDSRQAILLLQQSAPSKGRPRFELPQSFTFLAPAFVPHRISRLAMLAFPLGLAQTLISVTSNIPRYFIERYAGAASLGIFAAIMYLMIAGNTVVAALAQSCTAQLARLYAQRDLVAFRTLLLRQMLSGFGLGVVGVMVSIIWGTPLLRLIYRPEYAEHSDVLVLAMIAAWISYVAVFAGTALTAVRLIKPLPFIYGTHAAVACLLCALLVPRFGILGGSWAVLLTEGFHALVALSALYFAWARGRQRRV
jgi:O-antigen/teichoic acid export membrane protein